MNILTIVMNYDWQGILEYRYVRLDADLLCVNCILFHGLTVFHAIFMCNARRSFTFVRFSGLSFFVSLCILRLFLLVLFFSHLLRRLFSWPTTLFHQEFLFLSCIIDHTHHSGICKKFVLQRF